MGVISCLVGDVGSGKTLKLVVDAIQASRRGRDVYMNFKLKPEFAAKYPGYAGHIHYVGDFLGFLREREYEYEHEANVMEFRDLFEVDEAQAVWNSRMSMVPFQVMLTDYIFISRKLGLELKMTTQLASSLDKRAKQEVAAWVVCTKYQRPGKFYESGYPVCDYQYQYYNPEQGELQTRVLYANVARIYYQYYSTTAPTSTSLTAAFGEEDTANVRESGTVTGKQFKKLTERVDEQGKALRLVLKDLDKIKRREDRKLKEEKRNVRSKMAEKTKAKKNRR